MNSIEPNHPGLLARPTEWDSNAYDNRIVVASPYPEENLDKVVDSAKIGLFLGPERAAARLKDVRLWIALEIVVDEHSGEDGAASPDIRWRRRTSGAISALAGQGFAELGEVDEAWFGNDADQLDQIVGRFGQWRTGNELEVSFMASCGLGWMQFSGVVPVSALGVGIGNVDASLTAMVEQAFGVAGMTLFEQPPRVEEYEVHGKVYTNTYLDWIPALN